MKKLKRSGWADSGNYLKENGLQFMEQMIDPRKLKPNPDNPYTLLPEDDYFRLKKDIDERGIIDPLIADSELMLITGHNRLRIALELGLAEIPVRRLLSEVSRKEKEKMMLLDNLLRRQLSPEEKRNLILLYYGEDISSDNRGGNQKEKAEFQSLDVSRKIAEETGIPQGTVKRILAEERKKIRATGAEGLTFAQQKKILEKQILSEEKAAASLSGKIKKLEKKLSLTRKNLEKLRLRKEKISLKADREKGGKAGKK